MYFWRFNISAKGAFIDELGKIVAGDVEELMAIEYPEFNIIETIKSGEYNQCGCDQFSYLYRFKLQKKDSDYIFYVDMEIGEETGQVSFNIYSEQDYKFKCENKEL